MSLLDLRWEDGVALVGYDRVELARYVFVPTPDVSDRRRPYLHPLRSLDGTVVTAAHPADHPWHQGVQMTAASLAGSNFWGGPTYVRDRGYVRRDDHGAMVHRGWEAIDHRPEAISLVERLEWIGADGAALLSERRTLWFGGLDASRGCWRLRARSEIRNISDAAVAFASPATEGRTGAGYGGLFWRGAERFTGGTVTAAGGVTGEAEALGRPAEWLAFAARADAGGAATTVVFVDRTPASRPIRWFVRCAEYPGVSFSPAFERPYPLASGADLTLDHELIVATGQLGSAEADLLCRNVPAGGPPGR